MGMIILLTLLFAIGLFCISSQVLHLNRQTLGKRIKNISNQKVTTQLEIWFSDLSVWVAKWIPVSEYRIEQLAADIKTAGLSISPEMYVSNAIVKGGFIGLFGIPMLLILTPVGFVIIVVAVLITVKELTKLSEMIKDRRENIEAELPRFVSNIEKTVKHNRDVLSILERYSKIAGSELKEELLCTIADMRTGNYEIAITRLEGRVGSALMSDVTRGLISIIRGDDTVAYWTTLNMKMTENIRARLKDKAVAIPAKTKRLSFMLLCCFMMMYVVALGVALIGGFEGMIL